jgi:hypothetical protein
MVCARKKIRGLLLLVIFQANVWSITCEKELQRWGYSSTVESQERLVELWNLWQSGDEEAKSRYSQSVFVLAFKGARTVTDEVYSTLDTAQDAVVSISLCKLRQVRQSLSSI